MPPTSTYTAMPITSPLTSKPFTIPWRCLDENPVKIVPQPNPNNQLTSHKTFAQVLSNVCDIPDSQLPKPTLKGDKFSILIPDDEYDLGLDACKNNLHARVIWPKGSTPLTIVALKDKLKPVWKDLGPWGVTSIGQGFYVFVFSSIEDARRVRSVSSWFLNPGYLKLFPWTKDFNPSLQSNTSAQVWLRIHGLAQEYWRKKIIFAIASSVGTPICVDSVTSKPALERTFGHFARVLVDLDLSKELKYEVLVERKGFAFFVELEYEKLPEFCDYCKLVGHNSVVCRKFTKDDVEGTNKTDKVEENAAAENGAGKKSTIGNPQTKHWVKKVVPTADLEIQNQNSFAALNVESKRIPDECAAVDNPPIILIPSRGSKDSREPGDEILPNENNIYSDDDSSSQASKFLDATQRLEVESQASSQETPVRIQQDMKFLQDSWANLAEADEDQIRLHQQALQDSITTEAAIEADIDHQINQEVQAHIDSSGFQLVTRKSSKRKTTKALVSKSSSSYLTRSKVPTRHSK